MWIRGEAGCAGPVGEAHGDFERPLGEGRDQGAHAQLRTEAEENAVALVDAQREAGHPGEAGRQQRVRVVDDDAHVAVGNIANEIG